MGKGTRLISLSHAGSVLAMPAPDCPALSWHQEGTRIHYMFVSGSWLKIYSDDIWGHEIANKITLVPELALEIFLPLCAQEHYSSHCPMLAELLQCQGQIAQL